MIIEISKNIEIEIRQISKNTIFFESLIIENHLITHDWLKIIDFLELFQEYTKNHLSFDVNYQLNQIQFKLYKSKSEEILLSMYLDDNIYAFSKLNAARITHKINRILARCDLFYQV